MIALLLKIGPWLAGLVGIIAGLFMRQQAKTSKAEAAQEVAESRKEVAEHNAATAQASANAAQERTNVENEIAGLPADAVDKRLRNDWTRP